MSVMDPTVTANPPRGTWRAFRIGDEVEEDE